MLQMRQLPYRKRLLFITQLRWINARDVDMTQYSKKTESRHNVKGLSERNMHSSIQS